MSQSEVEIVPLTEDQKAAIRELRFVWTNQNRTSCWGLTYDIEVAGRCPGTRTPVTKSRNPTMVEYDVMMGHPEAVALVAEIQDARSAA